MGKREIGVDPRCWALARYFLADIPNATEQDAQELAERVQSEVEALCDRVEGKAAAKESEAGTVEPVTPEVVDLMGALKAGLAATEPKK